MGVKNYDKFQNRKKNTRIKEKHKRKNWDKLDLKFEQ